MQDEYKALLSDALFVEFNKNNPQHVLVNAFILYSNQYKANWQFGFFDAESDKITAFVVTRKDDDESFIVEQQPQDDAMKEPTAKLLELSFADVTVDSQAALDLAIKCCEDEYKSDAAQSRILLLQNTPEYGTIWNVTVISSTFDVVNVKVDAKTGDVLGHSKHSLLDMQANSA